MEKPSYLTWQDIDTLRRLAGPRTFAELVKFVDSLVWREVEMAKAWDALGPGGREPWEGRRQ